MLKKIVLTIAAMAAMTGISNAANAFIENVPGINFKTSTNVKIVYIEDAVNTTAHQNYGLESKHTSGDTYYAASNLSTTIMKWQVTTDMGTPLTVATIKSGVTAGETVYTGWAAM